MKPSDYLKAAKAKILDPNNWTQHASARNADGLDVPPNHPNATRFCAIGALASVAPIGDEYAYSRRFLHPEIIDINDWRDHTAVMREYDQAIANAEAEGQ